MRLRTANRRRRQAEARAWRQVSFGYLVPRGFVDELVGPFLAWRREAERQIAEAYDLTIARLTADLVGNLPPARVIVADAFAFRRLLDDPAAAIRELFGQPYDVLDVAGREDWPPGVHPADCVCWDCSSIDAGV